MRIRDPEWRQFGSGMEKKVGSGINIPDPQHWVKLIEKSQLKNYDTGTCSQKGKFIKCHTTRIRSR
jgi:hypothetical protein